jgi:hypothetical protein
MSIIKKKYIVKLHTIVIFTTELCSKLIFVINICYCVFHSFHTASYGAIPDLVMGVPTHF